MKNNFSILCNLVKNIQLNLFEWKGMSNLTLKILLFNMIT